jgi:hypothetical protein
LAALQACTNEVGAPVEQTATAAQAFSGTVSVIYVSWIGISPHTGADANLRSITGSSTMIAVVTGFNDTPDGSGPIDEGGGVFVWSSNNITDDGGTRIVPNTSADAGIQGPGWVRIYSGPLNVQWFGAYGDGTHDDTLAIQAAINAAYRLRNKAVQFPVGQYRVSNTIYVHQGIALLGEGSQGSNQNTAPLSFNMRARICLYSTAWVPAAEGTWTQALTTAPVRAAASETCYYSRRTAALTGARSDWSRTTSQVITGRERCSSRTFLHTQ